MTPLLGAVGALVGAPPRLFSTFGADVLRLAEARTLGRALAHAAAALVPGLGAAGAGYAPSG